MKSVHPANTTPEPPSIRITTTLPNNNTFEGTLFTACPITNLIAINTAPPPTPPTTSPTTTTTSAPPPHPGTYHILPIPKIATFTLLALPPSTARPSGTGTATATNSPTSPTTTTTDFTAAHPPIAPLDPRALATRTTNAVARLKALDAKGGRGVGREAQDLFDALGRTLPTRWSEQSIVVLDAVVIKPPYRVEDCVLGRGQGQGGQGQGQQGALGRVRKVVSFGKSLFLGRQIGGVSLRSECWLTGVRGARVARDGTEAYRGEVE